MGPKQRHRGLNWTTGGLSSLQLGSMDVTRYLPRNLLLIDKII